MTDLSRLCMVCFNEKDENNNCRACRGDEHLRQNAPLLPLRTVIADRYCIGKAVKHNPEGTTYSAYDLSLNKPCTIREYYPEALSSREPDGITVSVNHGCEEDYDLCRKSFITLWNKLMRLRGLTSLICVTNIFQAYNTVYSVYDESERYSLRDYLLETDEGSVSWEKARILLMPVLSTLGTLHTSGVIHRGLNPDAFIFSADGKLKLTDFSIEQTRTVLGELDAEFFEGYTALEQYSPTGQIGTWTDIYSFSAVLFRVLIGATPIDSKTRAQNDRMMIPAKYAEKLPPYVINAVINGMQIAPSDRTRTVEQLRSNLSASPKAVSATAHVGGVAPQAPARRYPANNQYTERVSPPSGAQRPPYQGQGSAQNNYSPRRPSPTEKIERLELEKEEEEKKSRSKTALIVVLCAVVVLLAGAIVALSVFNKSNSGKNDASTTTEAEIVVVPNFFRLSEDYVRQNYGGQFTFEVVTESSTDVENGYILRQDIPADTEVPMGTKITITVSTGKDYIVLDNYVGSTVEFVKGILDQHHISYTVHERANDGTHPAKTVIATTPGANQTVYAGDNVTIYVWGAVSDATNEYVSDVPSTAQPETGYYVTTEPVETTTALPSVSDEGGGNEAVSNFPGMFGE